MGGRVYRFGKADAAADFDFRKEVDRSNPSEEIRQLFADDKHHASSFGHKVVATKIMELIELQDYTSDPHLGSWLGEYVWLVINNFAKIVINNFVQTK